jgi:glycine/D-amino acid oxidase-like deaminating enzyme
VARVLAESHRRAIGRAAEIVAEEEIDASFEFVDGYLFSAPGEGRRELERERDAAHRAGIADVHFVARAPVPGFETGVCLAFPRQAQFHALAYLGGLAKAVEKRGGRIHCGTNVSEVDDGAPARVVTSGGQTVHANDVVVATDTPFVDRVKMHTKQAAYRTYVVGLEIERASFPHVLLWDTGHPYH